MNIEHFYDEDTFTLTYVVYDEATRDAVVIDPVLDFDSAAGRVGTTSIDRLFAFLTDKRLRVHFSLETHAHADHLSGSQLVRSTFGAKLGIGEQITLVQKTFQPVFDLPQTFALDGSQFDRLLKDGERVQAGSLAIDVIATPGHTPACISYLIGDAVFTGDALFIEDYGTGRCDFPGGNAAALYRSIHEKLYALTPETRVFVGHDYRPHGRPLRWETTVGVSKERNIQLRVDTSLDDFVTLRKGRDATLAAPRLLYPSVQINIDGGHMPQPHANGRNYLTIPLDTRAFADRVKVANTQE